MKLEFKKFSEYPRGTFYKLLKDAYSFEPNYQKDFNDKWIEEDNFFYDNLSIADVCGFITVLNNVPIGFISWDPRKLPDFIILGHNCIISEYRGLGYGKIQLKEAIKRLRSKNPKKIIVTTDEILIPAQKNYESVDFKFVKYRDNLENYEYAGKLMDYEFDCSK